MTATTDTSTTPDTNTRIIRNAIVTAAGLGNRMQPLTADRCKPMVEVDGKPIIGHVLDRLVAAGVTHVAVNTHYKAEGLRAYLQDYAAAHTGLTIQTLHEDVLLDTGGGIKNLLQVMPEPDQPFFVVSGDSFWEDASQGQALQLMAQRFDPTQTDILLLLKDLREMTPTSGSSDYEIDLKGNLTRSLDKTALYAWTSIRIIKNHALFENTPEGPFSFLTLLDQAQAKGRLQGLLHEGVWHHFSTPADIDAVNNLLRLQKKTLTAAPSLPDTSAPGSLTATPTSSSVADTPLKRAPGLGP